jgi:hypothetical protein
MRGGARDGAGRPRKDVNGERRSKHTIYCTKNELQMVRDMLKEARKLREMAELDPTILDEILNQK